MPPHSSHSTHAAAHAVIVGIVVPVLFLGGISVTSDSVVRAASRHTGGILQGHANDLGRIDDPRGDQVAVGVLIRVVAVVFALHLPDAIDDHRPVVAGVFGDETQWIVEHLLA